MRTPDEHVGNGRRIRVMQRIDEQEERPLAGRSLSGVIEKKVLPERRVVVLVASVGQARPLGVSVVPDVKMTISRRRSSDRPEIRPPTSEASRKARDVVVGHFGKARRERCAPKSPKSAVISGAVSSRKGQRREASGGIR